MPHAVFQAEFLARLRAFVRRRVRSEADADDLLQDVLARLVERGGDVKQESAAAWLFSVARRALIDRHRARVSASRRLPAPPPQQGAPDASRELARCLEPMLEALDPDDRELLRRVDMEGHAQADLARELAVPVSTVKSRTQRARARLRAALTDCCAVATDSRGRPYDFEPRKGKSCPSCGPADGGCAPGRP